MCGLIGAAVASDSCIEHRIGAGLSALRHRGPDYQEAMQYDLVGRKVWLGHTRLSIIDLDNEANQPMCSDDGRYVLIFNGEIFNYIELRDELRAEGEVFRTRSDTEVLLKAWVRWGEHCLDKLDGMFAFVVLDKAANTLTCVRDPFGIKPFFYSTQDGAIFFASEILALLDLLPFRPNPSLQRAYDYLVHGDYDSNGSSFIDGVKSLMPAHVMVFDLRDGSIKSIRRWWSPNIEQTSTLSFDNAAEAVRDEFLLSVRRQLRSDVSLGAALSGGIDSSAVVCAIRHLEPDIPIHTFSFVASDSAISEEPWIDLVNLHVNAIPHKVYASAENLARDIDSMVQAQGEPFGSTSIYAQYRVFQLARENGITVTLDGQGADELLAGYSGYPGYRVLSHLSEGNILKALRFAQRWRQWPGRSYSAIGLDIARELLPDSAYGTIRSLAGRKAVPSWIHAGTMHGASVRLAEFRPRECVVPKGRRVINYLRSSLQYRGLPSLLRHGDRNSMHFSIESRVPFLTTRLCNLLYSLPEEYLISSKGETKSVFRAAMRGIVPNEILDRRDKVGFATPEHDWLCGIAPQLRDWLRGGEVIPFLDISQILTTFDNVVAGRSPFNWQIWRLVNYVRWWNLIYQRVENR